MSCTSSSKPTTVNCYSSYAISVLLKSSCLIYLLCFFSFIARSQDLPGFTSTGSFQEQELSIPDQWKNVLVNINAPLQFNPKGKTYVIYFALPNGNTIEWTKGKKLQPGDDWHFDIQHIAAQTRYIRNLDSKNNYIVAYLMATQKSWPTWKRSTPDSLALIKNMVDSITAIFKLI
jgi:hypothetical protein